WARRRPAVASLMMLVMVVTILGFGGIVWEWRKAMDAERATKKALEEKVKAQHQTQQALEHARLALYFNRIALAEREWQSNHVARADQILDSCLKEMRH